MDKGTTGVVEPGAGQAAAIEQEIVRIRENLGGLVSELDHRRQGLNPMVAARRHPTGFAIAGALIIGAVGAAILIHNARERRRNSWRGRGRRLKGALTELMEGRAATVSPKLSRRLLGAVATAAGAAVGRQLATRLFSRGG
jgi:hypothetical protein